MMSIYNFTVTLEDGTSYSLDKYKNQPMIIVNTATKCGLAPQFEQLEELYERYQSQGLIILGFPSNQFKQEVTSASDAVQACRNTYGVTFPMHQIIDINGPKADPLFDYLKKQAPGTLSNAIKWNFTKFLIDKEGNVVERFAPQTTPMKMTSAIEAVL